MCLNGLIFYGKINISGSRELLYCAIIIHTMNGLKTYNPNVHGSLSASNQNPDSPVLAGPEYSSDEAGDGPPMYGTRCTITYGGGNGSIPGLKMKVMKQTGVVTSRGVVVPTGPPTSRSYAYMGPVSRPRTAPSRRTGGIRFVTPVPLIPTSGFSIPVPIIPTVSHMKPTTSIVIIFGGRVCLFQKKVSSRFAPGLYVLPGGSTSRYLSERNAAENIMEHHTGLKMISGNKLYSLNSLTRCKYWYMPASSLPRSGVRVQASYVKITTLTTPIWLTRSQCLNPTIRAQIHHTALTGIDAAIRSSYL